MVARKIAGPKYEVFISYSHADEDFALRLEKALRRYSPPWGLRSSRRRLSVYRDASEANSNQLSAALQAALLSSAKLIVLCSPEAARSAWVNTEIREFATHRGGSHIIPLIVRGRPASASQAESDEPNAFPPSLIEALADEPWAADFRDLDFRRHRLSKRKEAWYHLLASIYEVPREKIEKRERLRRLSRALIAILSIVLGASLTYHRRWGIDGTASHWPNVERPQGSRGLVTLKVLPLGRSILSLSSREIPYGPDARLWSASTGSCLRRVSGEVLDLNPEGPFLLVSQTKRKAYALRLSDWTARETPYFFATPPGLAEPWYLQFGSSGTTLMQIGRGKANTSVVEVWSLTAQKEIGRVAGIKTDGEFRFSLNASADRLVATHSPGLHASLWDVLTGHLIAFLPTGNGNYPEDYEVDDGQAVVITAAARDKGHYVYALWNLRNGTKIGPSVVVRTMVVGTPSPFSGPVTRLSRNGSWVVRRSPGLDLSPVEILSIRPFQSLVDPNAQGRWIDERTLFLNEGGGKASLWDFAAEKRISVELKAFASARAFALSSDLRRAVVIGVNGTAELRDLEHGTRLRGLALPSEALSVRRSTDGEYFAVVLDHGSVEIFSFAGQGPLAEFQQAEFGSEFEVFFDPRCRRINVWTLDGRVVKYREKTEIFGRTWATIDPCAKQVVDSATPASVGVLE